VHIRFAESNLKRIDVGITAEQ